MAVETLRVLTLKCSNCGGALEIGPDTEFFACGYCGANQLVERKGGIVSLRLADAIGRVQAGTDKTAAELALRRLGEELEELKETRQGWEQHLRAKIDSARKSNSTVFKVFGLAPAVIGLLAAAGSSHGSLLLLGACIWASAIGYLTWKVSRDAQAKIRASVAETLETVDQHIADRQSRIAKNRAIANA